MKNVCVGCRIRILTSYIYTRILWNTKASCRVTEYIWNIRHQTVDVGCQNTLEKKTEDCVCRVPDDKIHVQYKTSNCGCRMSEYFGIQGHKTVYVGCQNVYGIKCTRL